MVSTRRRSGVAASQSSQPLAPPKPTSRRQSNRLKKEIPDSDEEEETIIQVVVPARSASRTNSTKPRQSSAAQSVADSTADTDSSFRSDDELALPVDTPATSFSTSSSTYAGVLESAAETVASRRKTAQVNLPVSQQPLRRSTRGSTITSTQQTNVTATSVKLQTASSIPNKLGMRASKPVPVTDTEKVETETKTTTVKRELKMAQISDDEKDVMPLRSRSSFKKPVLKVPDTEDDEEEEEEEEDVPLIRSRDKGKGKVKIEDESDNEVILAGRKRARRSSGPRSRAKKTKVEPFDDLDDFPEDSDYDDEESLYEEDWDSEIDEKPKKSAPRPAAPQGNAGPSNAAYDSDSDLSDIPDDLAAMDGSEVEVDSHPRRRRPVVQLSRGDRERQNLHARHPQLHQIWTTLGEQKLIEVKEDPQPKGLTLTMLPFQLEGLHWLREQEKSLYKGGILADEMGMGKTIQTIALLMSEPRLKPTLVVAPTVALMQWNSEISKHTGDALSTIVFHSTKKSTATKKELENADVVMTTYSVLESAFRKENTGFKRKDGIVKEKSLLHSIKFARVILDEAHNIKDRTCNTARACFALQTTYKLCLTGTPLQNRIGEFFSLLRFLEIDPFAFYYCRKCPCKSLHWKFTDKRHCDQCNHRPMDHCCFFNNEFLKPIQNFGHTGPGRVAMDRLQVLLKHIMLRRTKVERADDLCLPPRVVEVRRDYFNEEELDLYDSIYGSSKRKFDTYVAQGVVLNNYANIFTLITRMRQLADHPDLVLRRNREEGQNTLVCVLCDEEAEEAIKSRCHHVFCRMCVSAYIEGYDGAGSPECPRCHIDLNIDLTQPSLEAENTDLAKKGSIINRIDMSKWRSSTKIEALVEELLMLRSKDASKKAIVFSQFTSMLQLVEWRLHRAGFHTVMLEGSMSPSQRESTINHFMTDINVTVFLVSLKAGGVALNLTEASHVFIMDPWWNPSVEWQSGDRVHRIGQRRPCKITRLVVEDSIESRIVELQEKKANMIGATVNGDQSAMEKLTPADMQFLFQN